MTKQFIQFNKFKQLILEAEDDILYWKGGIFWSVYNDVVDFHYCVLNDKQINTIKSNIEAGIKEIIRNANSSLLNSIRARISDTASSTKEVSDYDDDTYKLYYQTFNITDSDDAKTAIINAINDNVLKFVRRNKIYVQAKMLNSDKKFLTDLDNMNEFAEAKIERMSKDPERFKGYDEAKSNLKELMNMSTMNFLKKYGRNDLLGALLIKGGINLFKAIAKRMKAPAKNNTFEIPEVNLPKWKDDFKSLLAVKNIKETEDLKQYIENYNDDVSIVVNPNQDLLEFNITNKSIFTYKISKLGEFNVTFNLLYKDLMPQPKTITIYVKPLGESV